MVEVALADAALAFDVEVDFALPPLPVVTCALLSPVPLLLLPLAADEEEIDKDDGESPEELLVDIVDGADVIELASPPLLLPVFPFGSGAPDGTTEPGFYNTGDM